MSFPGARQGPPDAAHADVAIGFTTLLAFGLITFVGEVPALGGTTALLLLCVFTVVNVAVLVLRKRPRRAPAFPHADDPAGVGRSVLRVPRRSVDRPQPRSVRDCRDSARHRRRAVGGDGAGQSRHRDSAPAEPTMADIGGSGPQN